MIRRSGGLNLSTCGGLAAIVLWSATFAVARRLSEQVGPLAAGAAVYLFGALLCWLRLAWVRARRFQGGSARALEGSAPPRASSPDAVRRGPARKYLLGCGFLFVLYTTVIYLAVGLARDRDELLQVALINYLWPAATVLLSPLLLNRRAGWLLAVGTLLALAGVFMVMTQGDRVSWSSFWAHWRASPIPNSLALAGALAWALYSNLARRWSPPGSDGGIEWFMAATGLTLLALCGGANQPVSWNGRALTEAAFLGAITASAYALLDVAMRKGDLLLVAACSFFTPLLSTLVSCAYLRVAPGPRVWLGCALIVAGSLITWRSVGEPKEPRAEAGP